jgi:hypothetical protein
VDDKRRETVRVVLTVLRPLCEEIDQLCFLEERARPNPLGADARELVPASSEQPRDANGCLERARDGLQDVILELEDLIMSDKRRASVRGPN